MIDEFFTRYEEIFAEGVRAHPPRRAGPPGSRRRVRQTPAYT
jgi:transposase